MQETHTSCEQSVFRRWQESEE